VCAHIQGRGTKLTNDDCNKSEELKFLSNLAQEILTSDIIVDPRQPVTLILIYINKFLNLIFLK